MRSTVLIFYFHKGFACALPLSCRSYGMRRLSIRTCAKVCACVVPVLFYLKGIYAHCPSHVISKLTAPRAALELWRLWFRQAQHTATCREVCACAVLVFNFQKGCTCSLRRPHGTINTINGVGCCSWAVEIMEHAGSIYWQKYAHVQYYFIKGKTCDAGKKFEATDGMPKKCSLSLMLMTFNMHNVVLLDCFNFAD